MLAQLNHNKLGRSPTSITNDDVVGGQRSLIFGAVDWNWKQGNQFLHSEDSNNYMAFYIESPVLGYITYIGDFVVS